MSPVTVRRWRTPLLATKKRDQTITRTSEEMIRDLSFFSLLFGAIFGRTKTLAPASHQKSHRIHGTNGIFTYMNGWFWWFIVGKYTSLMEPMGMKPYLKCVCIYTQYKGWDFLYVYQLQEFFHQLMQEIYIYYTCTSRADSQCFRKCPILLKVISAGTACSSTGITISQEMYRNIWVFPKIGVPQNGWWK